ncbi:MAG: efflux RND transporter periplasmic adaptor subunit, partial [Acidobacteriota bacterium]|nr:efflux RND transporter periplasmic adaptor subunit [Acidobacteriota bacterium]
EPGDPLIGFDDSSLADRVRVLEAEILNAEIAILSSHNQLASQLKDLEIELAEKQFERDRAALLASIDPEVLSRKEYSERQLAFSKAEESLAETQERLALTQGRGTTQAEVLRIDREKKKKDLRTARSDLSLLTIQAPAAGLVVFATRDRTTTKHQEGDSCWPGQVLVSLPDLSEMKAVFLVNEVDAPQLEVGMPIEIDLDAFPGQTVSGQIEHIPSMAVRRSDSSKIAIFRVEATLSETWSDGMMKPGMSARGRVVLDRHADAPLVARGSVASDGETYWLFTASGRTTIDPIARNSTHYLLTEDAWSQLTVTAPEAGGATGVKDAAP